MYIITQIIRIFVGLTFVFSGFVKLVDPIGSAYKFQDYFAPDVLNLEFLVPYALPFAILLILAELMLGIMLLLGVTPRFTLWSIFFLTLFFLFLTWYSAYFNKVTDCGCFGDAIKLTPWETFYKNVVLIVLIVVLLFRNYDVQPILAPSFVNGVSVVLLIISLGIISHVLRHLPIIDFRPYAIGKNIPEGMVIPEGAPVSVYEDTWIYEIDGVQNEYKTEEKPWNIDGANYVDRKTKLISEGYVPPIHDFTMELDGVDIKDQLLEEEKLMLVVMYNLDKSSKRGLKRVKEISDKAMQKGFLVYGFSASTPEDFLNLKKEYGWDFDLLFCDETTLKTIIRGNPGIVRLNRGTVTGKWNWRDFDEIKLK